MTSGSTIMQQNKPKQNKNGSRIATPRTYLAATAALVGAMVLSGCHVDMWIQPKAKANYESDFFSDRQVSRPLVAGTVSQNGPKLDSAYYSGFENGRLVKTIPAQAVRSFGGPKAMLDRGEEVYDIYCQPCHSKVGDGNGMISQRGLGYWQKLPASYHTDRLRRVEDGHIYDVLVNGYGVMYGYASRIQNVDDRWAVVAYIRALQLAQQGVPEASVPAEARADLQKQPRGNNPSGQNHSEGETTTPTPVEGTEKIERPINRTPGGVAPGASNHAPEPSHGGGTAGTGGGQ